MGRTFFWLTASLTLTACHGMAATSDCSSGNGAATTSACPSITGSGVWTDRTCGTDASGKLWRAVASNASGDRLVAANGFVIPPDSCTGDIWTSTNAARTWTASSSSVFAEWVSVASDSAGTNLAAVVGGGNDPFGDIWTSADAGTTWNGRTLSGPAHGLDWASITSDATGTHLVAVVAFGDIFTSTDAGATWMDRTPAGPAHGQDWVSVASDVTGTYLVAVAGGGQFVAGPGTTGDIWTSTDAGATWTDRTPSGPAHDLYWASVASDSTGTHLVAVGSGIFTSANAGVTWTQQVAPSIMGPWSSVASDATGTHLVAADGQLSGGGNIWTSIDSGMTWTNQTAGTSAADQAWTAVASDSTGAHLVGVVRGGDIWTN